MAQRRILGGMGYGAQAMPAPDAATQGQGPVRRTPSDSQQPIAVPPPTPIPDGQNDNFLNLLMMLLQGQGGQP